MQPTPTLHTPVHGVNDIAVSGQKLGGPQSSVPGATDEHKGLVAWELLWIPLDFRHGNIPCLWDLSERTVQLIRLTNVDDEQIGIGLEQKIEASGIEMQCLSSRSRLCSCCRNTGQKNRKDQAEHDHAR